MNMVLESELGVKRISHDWAWLFLHPHILSFHLVFSSNALLHFNIYLQLPMEL